MDSNQPLGGANERDLFLEALEQPTPEARAAYLERMCGRDSRLRTAVEDLLAHHHEDSFLEEPALGIQKPLTGAGGPPAETVGGVIGRYKLLQNLGEGGCGAVYMAEQEEPVRRRVALKVIKLGMDTKAVIARFEAERQALALMDHPNIAKVLDAGATETGRPYFVMELVRGIKITDYCDQNHLATRERLDLFIKVCQAIQHAHQKGIIHRDLKPSNILVTLHDGVPVPKVIDFGIAKATTDQRLTDKTLFTALEQFIGTPAYMSPEQAEMSGLDIDTRSDIYSLGVLLYELLTGKTPFDAKDLVAAGLDEMRRTIRQQEPARPSTRLTRELAAADSRGSRLPPSPEIDQAEARARQEPRPTKLDSAALRRQLQDVQGDLDWVVMKCLEKDRTRRYETANGLARDLQRHLNNEPVVARPPSAAYRIQKFIRRNKATVTAITIIATVLVLGLFASAWEAIRARTAEHRAQTESARALGAEKTATEKSQIAETQRQRAVAAAMEAHQNLMEARQNLYAADMSVAQRALAEHDLRRARTLLDRYRPSPGERDLRGFEWRRLWQLCQNNDAILLEPRVEWPRCVVVSFDGKLLAASKKEEGPAFVWDTASWRLLKTLAAGDRALAFAPRKPLLVTGGRNGLKVWSTTTWSAQYLARCHPDTAAVFSRDGHWLVVHSDDLQLWDTTTWRLVASNAVGPINWFNVPLLACAPNGTLVACGSGFPPFATGEVHLLRLPSLQPLRSTKDLPSTARCLTFTSDSRQLVVSAWDGSIRIWEIATWKETPSTLAVPSLLNGMVFSPADPNLLATVGMDGALRLWDFAAQKEQLALHRPTEQLQELAFSPDGSWLAVGGVGNPVMIFSTRTRKSGDRVANIQPILRPLAFSSDSRRLLTLDAAGQLAFWDAGAREFTPSNHSVIDLTDSFPVPGAVAAMAVAVSPDLHWLAVGGGHGQVRLWNLEAKSNYSFTAHAKRVCGLGFSADSRNLATVGEDSLVRVWNLGSQEPVASLPLGEELPRDILQVNATFSADGRFLAASSFSTVKVWDARTWTELRTVREGDWVSVVKFSPDGRTLVISCFAPPGFDRWDTATWTRHHLQAGNNTTWDVAFSPDGRRLASMAEKAILWDTTTWEELASFKEQTDIYFSLFSPDGNKLALCPMSGGLRLLCAPPLQEIEAQEAKRGRWP